jgi:hypothetical protein
MEPGDSDPLIFRPVRRLRTLQFAIGIPLSALVFLPTLFAVWVVWAPHTIELRIEDEVLHITTAPAPLKRVRSIDLASVTSVDQTHLGKGRRTAGTALPGYCAGNYRYPDLGNVWIATDCSRDVIVLRLSDDKPVLLTPPDRQAFLDALESRRDHYQAQSPPKASAGWFFVKLLVILVPFAALLIPVVFLVAPGRLRYRLEPGTLAVVTMLGTRRFDIGGATARPHRPSVGIRLWGTGAPGYYTGLFRADGVNTKLYTTSVEEGVLIEGTDFRVFINPARQTEFLAAFTSMGGISE